MKDPITSEWIVISDADVDKLIAVFPAKWKLALRVLAIYGMRISELLSLTPANIRIENGEHVLIFQRVKRGKRKDGTLKPPVTSRQAIPERIRGELLALAATKPPSARLFPITRVYFWRLMQSAAYRAGVDPKFAHPHSVRHNRGRHWVTVPGATIWEVQRQLGHRSLTAMHVYTQLAASVEASKKFLE